MASLDKTATRKLKTTEIKPGTTLPPPSLKGPVERLAALLAEAQRDEASAGRLFKHQRVRQDIAKPLRWFMAVDVLALMTGFFAHGDSRRPSTRVSSIVCFPTP